MAAGVVLNTLFPGNSRPITADSSERNLVTRKPPIPVSIAFLPCRQIVEDPSIQDTVLVGLPRMYAHHHFPSAAPLGVFARWSSAHGEYQVELQLVTPAGEVVWKEGPPEPWRMPDPLMTYDLKLTVNVVFPGPGFYDLLLLANGDEVARQRFEAKLVTAKKEPSAELEAED